MLGSFVRGAFAGTLSTVPMTAYMIKKYRELPRDERYPLPPSTITRRVEQKLGLGEKIPPKVHHQLTWLSHFSYGCACGALYGLTMRRVAGPRVLKGILFGLGVWAVSYGGYLPWLGLSRSAFKMPRERNWLMMGAHIVWGSTLGVLGGPRIRRQRGI